MSYYGSGVLLKLLLVLHFSTSKQYGFSTIESKYSVAISFPQIDVAYGEKVELVCLVQGNIENRTRQWVKGEPPFDETLSVNGTITAKDKKHRYSDTVYFVTVFQNNLSYDNSFILTIYDFSESDLNIYTCIKFGIRKHQAKFDLKGHFVYVPNDEDYDVRVLNEDNSFTVVLNISKIYPEPICRIYIKDREIDFAVSDINLMETFYAAVFQKQFLILQDECDSKVFIACQIRSRTVKLNNTYTAHCYKEKQWRIDIASVVLGVAICVFGVTIGINVCVCKGKMRLNFKKHEVYLNNSTLAYEEKHTADDNRQDNEGLLESNMQMKNV